MRLFFREQVAGEEGGRQADARRAHPESDAAGEAHRLRARPLGQQQRRSARYRSVPLSPSRRRSIPELVSLSLPWSRRLSVPRKLQGGIRGQCLYSWGRCMLDRLIFACSFSSGLVLVSGSVRLRVFFVDSTSQRDSLSPGRQWPSFVLSVCLVSVVDARRLPSAAGHGAIARLAQRRAADGGAHSQSDVRSGR